jgi:outer membrane protein TolC
LAAARFRSSRRAPHEALVRYKRTIIGAVEDVDQAIVQYHLNLQRRNALGAAQNEIRGVVVVTRERYRRGETELTAVLDVQRRYYATADRVALAAEDAVLGYVALYKALGGGWELYVELPPIPPAQPAISAAIRRLTAGWHWH